MCPTYITDRLRKYLAGRKYQARASMAIFGGGRLPAGTILTATVHLGSDLRPIRKGVRHPDDLWIAVEKLRRTKQPHIYDEYWIHHDVIVNPNLVKHLTKRELNKMRAAETQRAIKCIRSFAPTRL